MLSTICIIIIISIIIIIIIISSSSSRSRQAQIPEAKARIAREIIYVSPNFLTRDAYPTELLLRELAAPRTGIPVCPYAHPGSGVCKKTLLRRIILLGR